MEKHLHPALLLGVIGGLILFGANTVVSGTIWRPAAEQLAERPLADSAAAGHVGYRNDNDDGRVDRGVAGPGWAAVQTGGDVLFRTADGAYWTLSRPVRHRGGDSAIDCGQPALGPRDNLLDAVCSLDP